MDRRTCEGDDCNSLTNEAMLCEDCKAIDREPYVVEAIAADRARIAEGVLDAINSAAPWQSLYDLRDRLLRVVEGG